MRVKTKKFDKWIALACCVLLAATFFLPQFSYAKADGGDTLQDVSTEQTEASTRREETFFGKWGSGAWEITPKLDYSINGLGSIERLVKMGDYASAKESLLRYYKQRDSVRGISPTAQANIAADLELQNIIAWDYNDYLSYTTVTADEEWYSFRVLDGISLGKQIGFELMARGKHDNPATFGSRESAHSPYLELTVNGTPVILYPQKDATVRAGKNRTVSYGTRTELEVNDTGYPADDTASRALLVFDLSKLSGLVSAANLKVYGSATRDSVEIMALRHVDIAWNENTISYSNANLRVYSWEGNLAAWNWGPPDGCTVQFDLTTLTLKIFDNLLMAYHSTKRAAYAQKAIEVLACVARAGGDEPRLGDPLRTGSRGENMTNQFAYLVKTPYMTADECFDIVYYMWVQGEFLGDPLLEYPRYSEDINVASYAPVSNWGVTQTTGLYYISHYFYEFANALAWQQLSESRLDDIVTSLINVDGSYNEDCTSYTSVALNSCLSVIKLAELNGFSLSTGTVSRLMNCLRYVMTYSMPDGIDPNYGDATSSNCISAVRSYVNVYGEEGPLLYYVTRGAMGTEPDWTSCFYPANRWAVMRSGWDEDSLYMHINTQSGTHNHWDSNAVIMYAYGRNLLIDSGRKSYDDNDPDTIWQRKNVESHNTLQIDNDKGLPAGFKNEVLWFDTTDVADVYSGYNEQVKNANHTRTVLMIKDGFYIVSDYAENKLSQSRTYTLNWHLPVSSAPTVDADKKTCTNFGMGANLQIMSSVTPDSVTMKTGVLTQDAVGEAEPYPYMNYSYVSDKNFNTSTLLYPTHEGESKDVKIQAINTDVTENNDIQAMRIDFGATRGNSTAYYYLSNERIPAAHSFGDFETDGKLSYTEYAENGKLARVVFSGGKKLSGNSDILTAPVVLGLMTADYDGDKLCLEGNLVPSTDTNSGVKIYAPGISVVTVNGTAVEFVRDGDYIFAAKSSQEDMHAELDAIMKDLPQMSELAYEDSDTLSSARHAVDLYVAKGFSFDSSALEALEKRIEFLGELKSIAQDMRLLMPLGVTHDTQDVLASLTAQLKNCADGYGAASEVAQYNEIYEQLAEYAMETEQLAEKLKDKTHIKKSSLRDSLSESIRLENKSGALAGAGQGYNGFYYAYMNSDGTVNLMTETDHHSVNLADVYYKAPDAAAPRWGVEGTSSVPGSFALCYWKADTACTIRFDVNVWAGAYMAANAANCDGAYVCISRGKENSGYPFAANNGKLTISDDVLFEGYLDEAINGASRPVSYSGVFALEAGDVLWIGISPNVDSRYDTLVVDAVINRLEGAQPKKGTDVADVFAAVERIQNALFSMPAPEDVTLDDAVWIKQTEADMALFAEASKFYLYDEYRKVREAFLGLGASLSGDRYAVTVLPTEGGTVSAAQIYNEVDSVVVLSVVPLPGYTFVKDSVTINGETVGSQVFVMPAEDVVITARFERISYSVTAQEKDGATVTLLQDTAHEGDKIYYSICVPYGYRVREASVKVNGEAVAENFFVMPAENAVLTYELEKIEFASRDGCGSSVDATCAAGGVLSTCCVILAFVWIGKRRKSHKC